MNKKEERERERNETKENKSKGEMRETRKKKNSRNPNSGGRERYPAASGLHSISPDRDIVAVSISRLIDNRISATPAG